MNYQSHLRKRCFEFSLGFVFAGTPAEAERIASRNGMWNKRLDGTWGSEASEAYAQLCRDEQAAYHALHLMGGYRVTEYHVTRAGSAEAPGEHYTVERPESGVPWLRTCVFYRTPRGSELATDNTGERLADDDGLYRAIRAAVEKYDAAHGRQETKS